MADLPNPDDAFDATKQDAIAEAMKHMSREEMELFAALLKAKFQKRKIQLTGYLVGIALWIAGMLYALVAYGNGSGFVGYVFLIPFGLLGVTLFAFGKWAEKVGNRKPSAELVEAVKRARPKADKSGKAK